MTDQAAIITPAAPGSSVLGALSLIARVALGGLFLYAAYMKLDDPQLFAQAIEKFKLTTPGDHDHLVKLAAFSIPWVEAVCGTALILGLWTRASALVLIALLGFFTYAIFGVISRGETFKCSCFGRLRLFCPEEISRCNLKQNAGMMAVGLIPLIIGGGRFSLDAMLFRRRISTARVAVAVEQRGDAPATL